jgi:acetyl esterase/lipase
MTDTEIGALRQKLASRVRSDDYRQRRKDMDARALEYKIAPDVTVEPVTANGVQAEWTSTPNDAHDAALIWLHGGGYVIGSLVSHRHLVSEAGQAARIWALALDYRLAPEHPFPAAVEDAVSGYRYLLSRGVRPGRIAIAGDSAGGGLVVAAMIAIREAGLAQPACGWCISPWVDMEAIGETMSTKAEADPMVQRPGLLDMAGLYLGGADPRSPLAAPIYADLQGLAPLRGRSPSRGCGRSPARHSSPQRSSRRPDDPHRARPTYLEPGKSAGRRPRKAAPRSPLQPGRAGRLAATATAQPPQPAGLLD